MVSNKLNSDSICKLQRTLYSDQTRGFFQGLINFEAHEGLKNPEVPNNADTLFLIEQFSYDYKKLTAWTTPWCDHVSSVLCMKTFNIPCCVCAVFNDISQGHSKA